ncbi:MAG: tRNA (guanosine(37)-N1)-methyltransferase TrmD [Acidobacteria bacterium]|nr:MAG: tRNA (guanosine(37)-N1)-methyltransferase TrmD [Acidobacteriota bacterium]
MRFDVLTIFPGMFRGPLEYSILKRAQDQGIIQIHIHDLRDYATDKHRMVDDRPFGGGAGMVFKPEPIFRAVETLIGGRSVPASTAVILLSPQGRVFHQREAERLSRMERLILICGRYEGVDERVAEHLATDEISIGDYILTGGEIPAMVIIDAVTRLLPGALGHHASAQRDSFAEGILDYPQYTRPADFRGLKVPDILLSGHHAEIERWRRRKALEKTLRVRPDLLARAHLDERDRALLDEIKAEQASRRRGDPSTDKPTA